MRLNQSHSLVDFSSLPYLVPYSQCTGNQYDGECEWGDVADDEIIDFEVLSLKGASVRKLVPDLLFAVEPAEEDGEGEGSDGHEIGRGQFVEQVEYTKPADGEVAPRSQRQRAYCTDGEDDK